MCAITSDPFPLFLFCQKFIQNILNRRLVLYTDVFGSLPEEQAGFREGYSTVDHIFSFYAMAQKQFSKNEKLYVVFIDYGKCLDSINRKALFKILECNGITGNFLNAIKALYTTVLAAVRNKGETSYYFQCPNRLKQGCLLSPKLFTIFTAEASKFVSAHAKHGVHFMPGVNVFFADDAILVSGTNKGLKNKLNRVLKACMCFNNFTHSYSFVHCSVRNLEI